MKNAASDTNTARRLSEKFVPHQTINKRENRTIKTREHTQQASDLLSYAKR